MSSHLAGDPPRAVGDRSASAIRAWVAVYTKGLPASQAADRQALIEADLWDETVAAEWMGDTSSLARQRLSRWARGVPADVTWRLEQRRMTRMPRRTDMRISKGQLAAIGVVTALYVVMAIGLLASPDFREWAGMEVSILGFGLSVVGLLLAIPRPQAGLVVGMMGIGLAFVMMPWLFPFYLPLPLVLGYRLYRQPETVRRSALAGE